LQSGFCLLMANSRGNQLSGAHRDRGVADPASRTSSCRGGGADDLPYRWARVRGVAAASMQHIGVTVLRVECVARYEWSTNSRADDLPYRWVRVRGVAAASMQHIGVTVLRVACVARYEWSTNSRADDLPCRLARTVCIHPYTWCFSCQ